MYQAVLIYYFFLFDAVAGRSDATDDAFMDIQPVAPMQDRMQMLQDIRYMCIYLFPWQMITMNSDIVKL